MSEQPLIQVAHLSRFYGPHCAVHDVSFQVRRGEVLGFLGPNGAGKTTTMQILTGNLAPSLGQVRIGGLDILDQPKQAKTRIGYLPEQPPLYRELTVDEYLRYAGRLNRIPRRRLAGAIDAVKERCGLTDQGRRLIGNLSKGYQQRAGIAQAVIHSPPVVVLDEPTVGLDPLQIREIRQLIRDLRAEHGVILSSHILPEVQATCDHVQIIHHGELVYADTIEGLERKMQASSLLLGLRRAPPAETLAGMTGVEAVEAVDHEHLRVHYRPGHNPAEALAEEAVRNHWGLYELVPERLSLEQVFVHLTRDETGAETGGKPAADGSGGTHPTAEPTA